MSPSTLVAPFCCHEALVGPLSLFITESSKVFWKFLQTTEHEVHFDDAHFAPQIMTYWEHLANGIFTICFFYCLENSSSLPQKTTTLLLNIYCLNKSLNSIGPTHREQVAYWFNLDKCTLLSRLNTSQTYQQLAQFCQVPAAIWSWNQKDLLPPTLPCLDKLQTKETKNGDMYCRPTANLNAYCMQT